MDDYYYLLVGIGGSVVHGEGEGEGEGDRCKSEARGELEGWMVARLDNAEGQTDPIRRSD